MSTKSDLKSDTRPGKRTWRRPELEEVGTLRDFVRSGSGFGKSGPGSDGIVQGSSENRNP